MACLIRAPGGQAKGCVSFTTQERDRLINPNPDVRAAVARLKDRYIVCLHHNWHDHDFVYDPLFDISMAGDGDLIERNGIAFPRIPIDACNFSAPEFSEPRREPFWDVLNVARAVSFKGLPEFLVAIRKLYDDGHRLRVLFLCPVPPASSDGTTLHDIRARYEALFTPEERLHFSLITMEWDYPFPLDLATLAFFYRSSRVFVHAAPEERRCRTAAYAWTTGMPVVASENVASILPPALRRAPFLFNFDDPASMADAILKAVRAPTEDVHWPEAQAEFRSEDSATRLARFLRTLDPAGQGDEPINISRLDIRLGRHHIPGLGPNSVGQSLMDFVSFIADAASDVAALARECDPEAAIAAAATPAAAQPSTGEGAVSLSRHIKRMFRLA